MSSGLVVVKCSNCHENTEIIPGTIVAECDRCGRLFRPTEVGAAASIPVETHEVPPWERSASAEVKAPWDVEKENMTPARPFPGGKDGGGLSASDAQDADAVAAAGALKDKKQRRERDKETRLQEAEQHWEMTHGTAHEGSSEEGGQPPAERRPVQSRTAPPPAPATPTASAAPAITIFVTLLLLAIGGYFLAKKEEGSSSDNRARRDQRPGRTAPASETPAETTGVVAPAEPAVPTPAPIAVPPAKALTVEQRIGMEKVEKTSVILSAEQAEKVKKTITHREKYPFHRWGSENPQIEVVVFAPFSHMGIARLKQLNTEFKKLEGFQSRIAVWFVFHWGSDTGLEAEAADLANAIHWTFKQEAMYHFVMLLQKEAIWRVAANKKFDEYIKAVGLTPAGLREKMKALPLQEIRKEVSDLLADLQLPDKDLTFLIGGRSYQNGNTLYNVSKIVDYELSAREPAAKIRILN